MKPLNKYILVTKPIEEKDEELSEANVLKAFNLTRAASSERFGTYVVDACADDCTLELQKGDRIVINQSLLETFVVDKEEHTVIHQNQVIVKIPNPIAFAIGSWIRDKRTGYQGRVDEISFEGDIAVYTLVWNKVGFPGHRGMLNEAQLLGLIDSGDVTKEGIW